MNTTGDGCLCSRQMGSRGDTEALTKSYRHTHTQMICITPLLPIIGILLLLFTWPLYFEPIIDHRHNILIIADRYDVTGYWYTIHTHICNVF